MTYAFVQDAPANRAIYEEIRTGLGDETPPGLISHVVIEREDGLRYIDVWETEADWQRFREERLEPVLAKVLADHGIPFDPNEVVRDEVTVIDTWFG